MQSSILDSRTLENSDFMIKMKEYFNRDPEASYYLGRELMITSHTIEQNPSVLRDLCNISRTPADKSKLLYGLLHGKFETDQSLDIAIALCDYNWSKSFSIINALEVLGIYAAAASALMDKKYNLVATELFEIERLIIKYSSEHSVNVNGRNVREWLSDKNINEIERDTLIAQLFDGKVDRISLMLAQYSVRCLRKKRYIATLRWVRDIVARFTDLFIAQVTSAKELTDSELQQIDDILTEKYSHEVQPYNVIDEDIIGGFIIQVSDDVIDLSIDSKLRKFKNNMDI
ncbi:MAG: F0F1 ATP synthase subunit delta [Bifidobacteriaceae bacterium]|jgi:F-type H+-transporting ATPase subunit delta|nr:F0F1 ATP synthase subunit delta [Bifidobacteriaceae bacterium]